MSLPQAPEASRRDATWLHAALVQAADGDLEWVKELLAAGADPNGMPLIMAIQAGEPEIVQEMIDAGAKVESDFAGTTPLVRAVQAQYPRIVKLLIDAGANVNTAAPDGTTPLVAATDTTHRGATEETRAEVLRALQGTARDVS